MPYLLLALVPTAIGAALVSGRERLRAEWRLRAVLAGCGGFLAYVLVLAALRLAPAAPVAAVRETSVLFAVALAAPLLGERVTRSGCRAPCSSSAGPRAGLGVARAWAERPSACYTSRTIFTCWTKWARCAHFVEGARR